MTKPALTLVDRYQAERQAADQANKIEFEKWKEVIGRELVFVFDNDKCISCKEEGKGKKKTIHLSNGKREEGEGKKRVITQGQPSIIRLEDICDTSMSLVFAILNHPDRFLWERYLKDNKYRVEKCISFHAQEYRGKRGEVIYSSVGSSQNFLTGWFNI